MSKPVYQAPKRPEFVTVKVKIELNLLHSANVFRIFDFEMIFISVLETPRSFVDQWTKTSEILKYWVGVQRG